MAINDLYRLSIEHGTSAGTPPAVVVFHYRQTTASPVGNGATNLINQWRTTLAPLWLACLNSSTELQTYRCRNLTTPTEGFDLTEIVPLAGTLVGQPYAVNTAQLVSWRTGLIGRSYRGRTYMPPPTEAEIDNGASLIVAQSGRIATWATAAQALAATASYAAFQLIVYSKKLNLGTPVTSYVVAGLATQRKRLR